MAPLPPDLRRYRDHLHRLLAWEEGQRWATQVEGENSWPHRRGPLRPADLDRHLLGEVTAGLVPDGHGSLCRYGALDLDIPRDAPTLEEALELAWRLQQAAASRDLPTLVVWSGRRGFHLLLPAAVPTPWGILHRALRRIARDVGLEPAELFPTKGKALRLPGGRHRISGAWSAVLPTLTSQGQLETIHGALEADLAAAASNPPAGPPEVCSWTTQVDVLEAFRPAGPQQLEDAAGEASSPDLDRLPEGTHPLCIQSRLEKGPLPGQVLHAENLLLGCYAVQRGLLEEDAEEMAAAFYQLLPEGFSTKTPSSAAKDFRQAFRDASDPSRGLSFRCSNAVAGGPKEALSLVSAGRCDGEACPSWPWGRTSQDVQGTHQQASIPRPQTGAEDSSGRPETSSDETREAHGRRLWQAIQKVLAAGQEVTLSLVLAAASDLEPTTTGRETELVDVLTEREFLAGCLAAGGTQLLAGVVLDPLAFAVRSGLSWEAWVLELQQVPPPLPEVWKAHLDRLSDLAIRQQTQNLGARLATQAWSPEVQPADTLAAASFEMASLLREVTPDLQPVQEQMEQVLADLVSSTAPRIPLRHPGLRKVFGGGLRAGQLVAAGGPPGCGKTTMALQLADETAASGFPVVFLSMEMTRTQLVQSSLSRLSGLETRALGHALSKASGGDGTATAGDVEKAEQALSNYLQEMAPRLYIVEGGPQHTPGRLQALVGQVRHQLDLPESHPVLVVVDYLQLLSLGAEGEANIREDLRVGALASAMKGLARSTGSTVLALSDITKNAMEENQKGGRIGAGVFRDSARILHAADTALVIQSGTVPAAKGKPSRNLLEVALEEPGLPPSKREQLEEADRPLSHAGDTIARWTVIKNRGGQSGGEVWSLYRRHLSTFQPLLAEDKGAEPEGNHGW